MEKIKLPSQREAVILASLINGEKYGREIRNAYEHETKRKMPLGSLYVVLGRMEDKYGFIKSRMGESGHKYGGNRRKYFKITGLGETALRAYEMLPLKAIFKGI